MSIIEEIKQFIDELHSVATIPLSLTRIVELMNNPESSLSEIAEVIEKDYALTMRVLKIVNSAYYSFKEKITSIKMAVVALGLNTLRSMATALSFLSSMKQGEESVLNLQNFWEHSLATAVVSGMAVKNLRPSLKEDVFVAGLLHDIGKVVLQQYLGSKYKKAIEASKTEDKPLFLCEKRLLGIDHMEAGSLLAKKWHLSYELIFSISNHHSKDIYYLNNNDKKAIYANAVCLANRVVLGKEIGDSGDAYRETLPDQLLNFLQLKPVDIVEIFRNSKRHVEDLKKSMIL